MVITQNTNKPTKARPLWVMAKKPSATSWAKVFMPICIDFSAIMVGTLADLAGDRKSKTDEASPGRQKQELKSGGE
jgi:hypothetical protein